MSDNIYDFLLRKRNVKLLLIRFLLYQWIFKFCFLLLTPNSVLYYTVTPNAASACKNCRKSQTRNTARAMCAPQNHPNYPSYHLQNQEGWSSETHFFLKWNQDQQLAAIRSDPRVLQEARERPQQSNSAQLLTSLRTARCQFCQLQTLISRWNRRFATPGFRLRPSHA